MYEFGAARQENSFVVLLGGGIHEKDKSNSCLSSARGTFINFLVINDLIILPEYTLPNYKLAMDYNAVNKKNVTDLGFKVITINCDDLAKLGGELHCVTFTN